MNELKKLMQSHLKLENGHSWSIGQETKEFLTNSKFEKSIETGIGYSTFIFAANSKSHFVFFPIASVEIELRKYAKEIDLSVDNVSFVVGKSQFTLPKFKDKVDIALIDGEHMFPCPMIDFYYININLNVNGFMLIDDMQIPSVRCLYDFLSESKDWNLEDVLDNGRLCVFKKLKHDDYEWWGSQDYNKKFLKPIKKPKKINTKIM